MTMDIAAALVPAIAPADLADAIGDLHEGHEAFTQTVGEASLSHLSR